MNYRQIIGEAWEFTQSNKKLIIWYAFFPSVLTTLAGIIYLGYQFFAFKSSQLFENWSHGFGYLLVTTVLQVIRDNFSTSLPFLIIAGVIVLLYFVIPPYCQGSIIQLIARKRNGQHVRTRDGFQFGMLSFLPLLEYSMLVGTFSLVSILAEAGFVARNLGMTAFWTFFPVLIVFVIVGIIMTFLFAYTQFFIVIDDRKVIESIAKSATLVTTHLEETIFMSILMLIISVRIILQILFVLLIPAVIIGTIYLFAASTIPVAGIVIGSVLGLVLLYLASYLGATIHVFADAVWTFSFLELTNEPVVSAREKAET